MLDAIDIEYRITDALEGLKSLGDESVDLIITDPPYNTLERWRSVGTTTRLKHSKSSSNDWFSVVSMDYLQKCILECYRVLKKNSYLFVFCDFYTSLEIQKAIEQTKFETRKPLIWEKVGKSKKLKCPRCKESLLEIQGKGSPGMGYPFRSGYEMIFFAQKGKRKPPQDRSVRDVLRYPRVSGKGAWPTQKPIELSEVLVRLSCDEGSLVLDPFAGSGSILIAANNLKRRSLGFEVNPQGFDFFKKFRGQCQEVKHNSIKSSQLTFNLF